MVIPTFKAKFTDGLCKCQRLDFTEGAARCCPPSSLTSHSYTSHFFLFLFSFDYFRDPHLVGPLPPPLFCIEAFLKAILPLTFLPTDFVFLLSEFFRGHAFFCRRRCKLMLGWVLITLFIQPFVWSCSLTPPPASFLSITLCLSVFLRYFYNLTYFFVKGLLSKQRKEVAESHLILIRTLFKLFCWVWTLLY